MSRKRKTTRGPRPAQVDEIAQSNVGDEALWPEDGAIVAARFIKVGFEVRKRGIWRVVEHVQGVDRKGFFYWRATDGSCWHTHGAADVRMRPVKETVDA